MINIKERRNTIYTELQRNDKGEVLQTQSQNGMARSMEPTVYRMVWNIKTVVVLQ